MDLAPVYRIEAIKTTVLKIDQKRHKIDKMEVRSLGEDREAIFEMLRDYTMSLSRNKRLEARDREPAPTGDDMDSGACGKIKKVFERNDF